MQAAASRPALPPSHQRQCINVPIASATDHTAPLPPPTHPPVARHFQLLLHPLQPVLLLRQLGADLLDAAVFLTQLPLQKGNLLQVPAAGAAAANCGP
jgi:hypothetical protein